MLRSAALIVLLLFSSIEAQAIRHRAKEAKAKYIDSLFALKPLSVVSLISNGNEQTYSDSLSTLSSKQQIDVLNHFAAKMKLATILSTQDSGLEMRIDREVLYLFTNASQRTYLEDSLDIPVIDSITKASGARYILLTANFGFMRTKANKRNAEVNSIFPALVTLGMLQTVPLPAATNMQMMILDLVERRTFYYCNEYGAHAVNGSPVSYPVLEKQFYALGNFWFWSIPQ